MHYDIEIQCSMVLCIYLYFQYDEKEICNFGMDLIGSVNESEKLN